MDQMDDSTTMFVYVLTRLVACGNDCNEGIPKHLLKALSDDLLLTVGKNKTIEVEVKEDEVEAKEHVNLYEVWNDISEDALSHCYMSRLAAGLQNQCELNHDVGFGNMGNKRSRLGETSAGKSIILTIQDTPTHQILLASKIRKILLEMIYSQQIKSLDSLYPLVKKAVQALKFASCHHPCVIGGELVNVNGVKDAFVTAPFKVSETSFLVRRHLSLEFSISENNTAAACLYNLRGSISYMISTIQCLHSVPELKSALFKWHPFFETSSDHLLTAATCELFKELDKNEGPVAPRKFLQLFEEKYCRLEQLDNHNPQDAEECWVQLLDTISRSGVPSENLDVVKDLFDIKLVSRLHSQESGGKPIVEKSVRMLQWYVSPEVDHLHDGLSHFLKSGLNEASSLSVAGLPRYLTIRFFCTNRRANYKIKLLEVDVYDLCSDELRTKLRATRLKHGLKAGERRSDLDQDVKWSGAELTGIYDLVTVLVHSKTPNHAKIVSRDHYVSLIKPKLFFSGGGNWFQYMDEYRLLMREKYIANTMRGGCGLKPYIALYKARAVPMD